MNTTVRLSRRRFLAALGGFGAASAGLAFASPDLRSHLVSTRKTSAFTDYPPLPSERGSDESVPRYRSLAIDLIVDTTSSTDLDYARDACVRSADLVNRLIAPGQGPISFFAHQVGPASFAPSSTLLAFHVPETPLQPSRRLTAPRPTKPDYSSCEGRTFSKQKCIEELDVAYQSELNKAVGDETLAQHDYQAALREHDDLVAGLRFAAKQQTDTLRALALKSSDISSDITGAVLAGSGNLLSLQAEFKLLLIQSDLIPFGKQSEGELLLRGVRVVVLDWDTRDAATAAQLRGLWDRRLQEAGAASLRYLTPAQTAVADLLEVR